MIEVSNQYIKETINNLILLLGIKEDISYNSLRRPFNEGKIKECIKIIADYLGLPIEINLIYVPSDYHSKNAETAGFTSNKPVKTDARGRGVERIVAQVSIPNILPPFGTSAFTNFPIDVKISNSIKRHPDTFMALMAHELSHVLLHSLWHKEKDNEIYVDIAAMLLGFKKIMKKGRKTVQHPFLAFLGGVTITTTYGYLSDEQFEFAYNEIKSFWNSFRTKKTELLVQIDKIKDLIRKTANLYKIFQKNFTWISEQLSRLKIKDKDTDQFVKMQGFVFQYPDFDKDLIEKEKSLDNLYEEIINKPYNPCETGKFDQWEIHLQNKLNEIKHYYIFLKTCLKTQLKYIEIKQKILTFLEIRKN